MQIFSLDRPVHMFSLGARGGCWDQKLPSIQLKESGCHGQLNPVLLPCQVMSNINYFKCIYIFKKVVYSLNKFRSIMISC